MTVDLAAVRHVHLVGIGGAGMSAYATVLVAQGIAVSGSDLKPSAALERLRALGVAVTVGHSAENVAGADLVARSSAVPASNPELVEAQRRGTPVVDRADLLAALCANRRLLAVSGTHGKTTTTSMTALALVEAGWRPAFLIGGDVNEIGTNAVWDHGDWIVVEADESDGTFLRLHPEIAVVTNVEVDHLDHYGSEEALNRAFATFAASADRIVVWADDPGAQRLEGRQQTVRVGTTEAAEYQVVSRPGSVESPHFALRRDGTDLVEVRLAVPGSHNVANAALAAVAAHEAGADLDAAARALERFAGVTRRFEFRGEIGGVRFVDDYAHLPTEVAVTVATARAGHDGRVVAVFQPHRYSRTAQLADAFGRALSAADVVVVTDVYPAGEPPVPGVTGRLVADAVVRHAPAMAVHYIDSADRWAEVVDGVLRPGDLCLTMGAGDITTLADRLRERHR